jgi:hypothetical protein
VVLFKCGLLIFFSDLYIVRISSAGTYCSMSNDSIFVSHNSTEFCLDFIIEGIDSVFIFSVSKYSVFCTYLIVYPVHNSFHFLLLLLV